MKVLLQSPKSRSEDFIHKRTCLSLDVRKAVETLGLHPHQIRIMQELRKLCNNKCLRFFVTSITCLLILIELTFLVSVFFICETWLKEGLRK